MYKPESYQNPYKYGDVVYYAHPPLDKRSVVVKLDDFDAHIEKLMVLGQFYDQVVVTSAEFVAKAIAEHRDYWGEKNEEGYYKNFSTHSLRETVVKTVWRNYLFPTQEAAITWQKECVAEAQAALSRFGEKLKKIEDNNTYQRRLKCQE